MFLETCTAEVSLWPHLRCTRHLRLAARKDSAVHVSLSSDLLFKQPEANRPQNLVSPKPNRSRQLSEALSLQPVKVLRRAALSAVRQCAAARSTYQSPDEKQWLVLFGGQLIWQSREPLAPLNPEHPQSVSEHSVRSGPARGVLLQRTTHSPIGGVPADGFARR